jgi:hypothetical protein
LILFLLNATKSGARAPLFFCAVGGVNIFATMFLYRNFSDKSAASFLQSGNICRVRPAIFSAPGSFCRALVSLGKSAPERFFRIAGKSMFKRI